MKLQTELESLNQKTLENAPKEILEVMLEAKENLSLENIEGLSLSVGDKMPEFTLKNGNNVNVSSNELLEQGSLIVNFYRGGW